MEHYKNVFQYPYAVAENVPFDKKGHWREYFGNDNKIVLELGCGKGEYTVSLAQMYPEKNFIGVDIKGARMWTGATQALQRGIENVAFLRTNIEIIERFFDKDEVDEIWLTFSDPQMKNPRKRLSSSFFLKRYRSFLIDNGVVHLKTDSNFLFTYTNYVVSVNQLPLVLRTDDLHHTDIADEQLREMLHIRTYYEQMWLDRGINIKYIAFRLPHSSELVEPDVELQTDDYRSYRRDRKPLPHK